MWLSPKPQRLEPAWWILRLDRLRKVVDESVGRRAAEYPG